MKEPDHTLSASVLATVLVVCTLMLLGVLMVINLWNMDLTRYYLYHHGEQLRANVESGFLLYQSDSTLQRRWAKDSSILLFDEQEESRVRFTRDRWGMYEIVRVQAGNGKRYSVRLMGKTWESDKKAILYIPENDRSFSLTGRTFLEGMIYLPRNGISYTQMRSEFFNGKRVKEESVRISEKEFPGMDEETCQQITDLLSYAGPREWLETPALKNSFSEPTRWIETGENLSGLSVEGRIILYAPDDLYLEQDNCLENVIIVGRKIEIADGFTGCIQVFARDTIILGNQVCLKAGSGLHVKQKGEGCLVKLGDRDEINGYVIVESILSNDEQKRANYIQPETSKVRGLVYVDGIAEVHGMVTGSLYARECYYFAPEGYYSGTLYNTILPGNPGVAYPLLMKGPHERKEVKWLE